MNWINQEYMVSIISLPRWGWGIIIAMLATVASLITWAVRVARARRFAADHEITQAFIREMRLADDESAPPPQDGPAGPDDQYPARPAVLASDRPGPEFAVAGSGATAAEAGPVIRDDLDNWESALEKITRAEDALVAASDPAAFYDWLAADWAAYLDDAADVDSVLDSQAWASTPWIARSRALAAAQ